MLFTLLSIAAAFVLQSCDACEIPKTVERLDLDDIHVAETVFTFCGGGFGATNNSYVVYVHSKGESPLEANEVFQTWDIQPSLQKLGANNLLIIINGVEDIPTSLHKLGSIEISYSISPQLKARIAYDNSMIVSAQEPAGGDAVQQHNFRALQRMKQLLSTFQQWTDKNVTK